MARIKLAYIGGGSTRAPGTMASLIDQGKNFNGSEIVLIDLDEERLHIVQTIAQKMARAKGLDLTISMTTDRRAAAWPRSRVRWRRSSTRTPPARAR